MRVCVCFVCTKCKGEKYIRVFMRNCSRSHSDEMNGEDYIKELSNYYLLSLFDVVGE